MPSHFDRARDLLVELGVGGARLDTLAEAAGTRYAAAGKAALDHGDTPGAISLLERSALLLADAPARAARLELGKALLADGRYEVADATFASVEADARAKADRHSELAAATGRLEVRGYVETEWTDERFVAESEALERSFDQIGDDVGAISAILQRVNWIPRQLGLPLAEKAAERAARAGATAQEIQARRWVLVIGFWGQMPATEGSRRSEEALARGASGREDEAWTWVALAGFQAMLGRFDDARQALARSDMIVGELGLRGWVGQAFVGLWIEWFAGNHDAAEAYVRHGVEELLAIGEKNRLSTLAAHLAWLRALAGDVSEAEQFLALAQEAANPDDTDTHATAGVARSVLATLRGDHVVAIDTAEQAVKWMAERGNWYEGLFLVELANAREAAGDPNGTREALVRARQRFEAKELVPMITQIRDRLDVLDGPGA